MGFDFESAAAAFPSPSLWLYTPGVRQEMERHRRPNKKRGRWKRHRLSKSDKLDMWRAQVVTRHRLYSEMRYAVENRLPVVKVHPTLRDEVIDEFFNNPALMKSRLDALRTAFEDIDDFTPRYCFVMESGEQRGRLHLHGLVTVSQEIASYLGDPARSAHSHNCIPWFQSWWLHGHCPAGWMRLSPVDYLAQDLGFLWPRKPAKDKQYSAQEKEIALYVPEVPPGQSLDPEACAEYLVKYLTKEQEKLNPLAKEAIRWRTKMSRGYGLQTLTLLSERVIRMSLDEQKKCLQSPSVYLHQLELERASVVPPPLPNGWVRQQLLKLLQKKHRTPGPKSKPNTSRQTEGFSEGLSIRKLKGLAFGQRSPIAEAMKILAGSLVLKTDTRLIPESSGSRRNLTRTFSTETWYQFSLDTGAEPYAKSPYWVRRNTRAVNRAFNNGS